MNVARPDDGDPGEPAAESGPDRAAPGPVHGLFLRRFAGDDALLELAGLRFAQMGVAAELYADTPDELERTLRFVPPHRYLPTVHLNRGINVLSEQDRSRVAEFADRFAGRELRISSSRFPWEDGSVMRVWYERKCSPRGRRNT